MRQAILALALAVCACGGAAVQGPGTTQPAPASSTSAPPTGSPPSTESPDSAGEAPSEDSEATADLPVAPDFTLELGDGGEFTLSEGERPVYLVFWAEWCPICRQELPVVDAVAADYGDRVDFVAPAWKSDFERTKARAVGTFVSGKVMWGLDEDEDIFQKYGVPYQPVTVLITADRRVASAWAGMKPEAEIRAELDALLALSG